MTATSTTLYPYHPVTGDRLVATCEIIPGCVPREISMVDDKLVIEEGSETIVSWNAQEIAQMNSRFVLMTDAGHVCLDSEVSWDAMDADCIPQHEPKPATAYPTNRNLMDAYFDMHVAVSCAVDNLTKGDIEGALSQLKGQLNALFDVDRLSK
ncbi:hypothetical protein IIE18_10810 [Pseudomonas sp. V1]|uniref:hypothetical protein n=1 Tax=Pseudomonas arcuscaelestis TaxID=2710591 RepID=UPI00193F3A5D|nr:hypothetical protein [Pseudomonas arcuscaelestis]MBM3105631.1 hypothetical protein [Pseudomonas arcuscaelestis]